MNARIFEGRFDVRLNKETGVISLAKASGGKYSAGEAAQVAQLVVEAAKKHKASIDRWSFYIKGVNQELAEGENLNAKQMEQALKAGHLPVLKAGKWGKPRLDLINPDAPLAKGNENIVTL